MNPKNRQPKRKVMSWGSSRKVGRTVGGLDLAKTASGHEVKHKIERTKREPIHPAALGDVTVAITAVETVVGNTITDHFNPYGDPITLRMVYEFPVPALDITGPVVIETFQLIELLTNTVVEQWRVRGILAPGVISWLILPTADQLGLSWLRSGIFGFRAAVELFSDEREGDLKTVGALDVSDIRWFHFEPIAIL